MEKDITLRTLAFAVNVVKFVNKLENSISGSLIARQLIGAGTSIGANVEEAQGAVSKKDFIAKIGISRKEARETVYWLTIIENADLIKRPENLKNVRELKKEAEELSKILSAIIINARKSL